MNEFNALRKQLSNEQTASVYADQFFAGLSQNRDAEQRFGEIIVSNIEPYKALKQIQDKLEDASSFDQLLGQVLRFFPSYGFIICNELDSRADFYELVKPLRIAVAASTVARKVDYQAVATLFLNQVDQEIELDRLEAKLNEGKNGDYLPYILNEDIQKLLKTPPNLKTTTNPHELIEAVYYFKAIKQIFLKIYFYLIGYSENDTVAVHVNRMLARLLLSIRNHEAKYWGRYKNGKKLHDQLMGTISKDQPKTRHPHLRKHMFDAVDKINPVFQNGTVKTTVIEVRQLLAKQLAVFYDFSINKLVLLLDTTLKTEGSDHVVYMLSQLTQTNIEKVFELHDHLVNLTSDKTKPLRQLVVSYYSKLPGAKKRIHETNKSGKSKMSQVYRTAETLRATHAKKRLIETEGKRGMTQDQVSKFLEAWLKKLYERVKKTGALTQDKVPEYLARFAALAEEMVKPIEEGKKQEMIEEFQSATEEILDDISSEGHLSTEEVDAYKEEIREKSKGLDAEDDEERAEIVDEIGVTLSEASFESDKRKESENLDEFLSKNIIPYGLDKQAKRISIKEFFQFPFGDFQGPSEEDWFNYHMKYLQLAVKENKLDKSNFVKIYNSLNRLPKIKYKKYFNIFPNEQFEETTFMAVFDLWKNKAFDRLRVE